MNNKFLALLGVSLISFVAFLEYTVVSAALPTLQSVFRVPVLDLQWIFNAYSIVVAVSMLILGRLGDLWGRRLVFYMGTFVLLAGSIGAGCAWGFWWLIFFRVVQSVGVAAIVTLGPSLIHDLFENNAHHAMGFFAAFTGVGLMIGPTVGGIIVTHLSWPWIFYINVPLLLIALACCLPCLKESKSPEKIKLDVLGVILLAISLVPFIYGLIRGAQLGWANPSIIACFVIAAVAFPILFYVENRQADPVLDFQLFAKPIFLLAAMSCLSVGAIAAMSLFFSPLLLEQVMGYTPKQAGVILLAIPLGVVVFSPLVAKVVKKAGLKMALFMAPLSALLAAIFHLIFSINEGILVGIIGFLLVGAGWAFNNVVVPSAAVSVVKSSQAGAAIGAAFSIWNISGAVNITISSIIFAKVYASHQSAGHLSAFISGFQGVFIFILALVLLSTLTGLAALCLDKKQV
ncbi:MAG: stp [Gammaproteobacteria bacterium]|nr:stp [Gammaproteobacteria bacterium]